MRAGSIAKVFWYKFRPKYIKIEADNDYKVFTDIINRLKPYVDNLAGKKVIDIGCGTRFPFTLLFHSYGADVVGIDIDVLQRGINFKKYREIIQKGGVKPFVWRLLDDLYKDRYYFHILRRRAEFPLRFDHLDLQRMDASHTIFKDQEFDLVVSNAVFIYISDIPKVIAEIKRIMKKGAIAHIEIPLFASLTGGGLHCLWSNADTAEVLLGKIPPWEHLRRHLNEVPSVLNPLRESQYKLYFQREFEILDWITEYQEPEYFLTPEISREFQEYSREELLKRSIVVIARKV